MTDTHYLPWDATDDFAYCGVYVSDARYHSPQPTCAACAAKLAAECAIDAAIDEMPWPLDADEARAVLDPVLNAGVPDAVQRETARVMSLVGATLFAFGVTLTKVQR
jgi:hypothetical protein